MKVVNIILVVLLVLFVILNLYYLFYVRRICLEKELQKSENFYAFQDSYTDEQYDTDNTFRLCDLSTSKLCSATYSSLESNNTEFINTHSLYHANYSLPLIQAGNYGTYNDVMTLKPLLSYRCIKKSPKDLKTTIESNTVVQQIPTVYRKMFLYSDDDLYTYIAGLLNEVKSNLIDVNNNKGTSKILSPVYVCISQAPYLNYQGEMIKSRFDVTHNKRGFYKETIVAGKRKYELETGNEASEDISSLYTEILLIFPLYRLSEDKFVFDNDGNRLTTFLNTIISPEISRDELCFLRCNKSPLSCGCLNANPTDMRENQENPPYKKSDVKSESIQSYTSTCLNNLNQNVNYSLLYYLNPYSGIFDTILMNTVKSETLTTV